MTITSTVAAGSLCLSITGRLDALTSPDFQAKCQETLAANPPKVVMNFEGVDYVSSAGVHAIVAVGKIIQKSGGVLALCGLKGIVKTVLEVSGLFATFPVYDSPEAALESR